jgi:ubiquinol-cytochrome c reductase cytochrome b subunit
LIRFYTLHFILPSILILLSLIHIIILHKTGSSRPLGVNKSYQRFSSFCVVKDSLGVFLIFFSLFVFYLLKFMVVSDSEQYIEANPFVTPIHIVPE